MTVLIESRSLRFSYVASAPVLQGLDLELAAGELLFVLGPNGCGKTTLVNLLSGVLAPQGGTVTLSGAPLPSLDARESARRVAVVPQTLDGVAAVRVEQFVLGGRYAHVPVWGSPGREDRRVAEDALEAVDARSFVGRPLGSLSAGQRQRVFLARALAQEAPALLLDEPTAALDPGHQLDVLDLVRARARAGSGVMVVTHDLNLTSQYADRVVLLAEGRVASAGPASEVLREDVLAPVYGPRLWFGTFPDSGRPIVLPRSPEGSPEFRSP